MSEPHAQPSDDLSAADWVITRLSPESGDVGMLLPPDFAAYARLLHPVITDAGDHRRLVRWRDIAPDLVPFDRRVQFPSIAAHSGYHESPFEGNMADEDLDALLAVLAAGTTTPLIGWFCVWDGYGDVEWRESGGGALHSVRDDGYPRIGGPQEREYWLFSGPLDAARTLQYPPALWWPDDQAWCVATDIDLDSTYIGGSRELIAELLASPDLEVLPADLHDLVWPVRE
jgi:hypothetical protein